MNNAEQQRGLPLAPSLAARMLSIALGESESTWAMRLANGRRPSRNSPIPWTENDDGNPIYLFDDVQAFIDKTLALRTVVSAPSDSRLAAKAAAVADVEAEQPFVRILWNTAHAQGAFALSLGAAKSLAHTLAVAVKTGGDRKRQIGDVA